MQAHLADPLASLQETADLDEAGPHPDESGEQWAGEGMVVIRADSMEDAEKIAAADPMHASGARSYKIRPWLVNEGKVTVELTFSNKGSEVI